MRHIFSLIYIAILTDEQLREGKRQLTRHKRTMVMLLSPAWCSQQAL